MMRQLFMPPVVGAPFDVGLATADFAREWARSALASRRGGARARRGLPAQTQYDLWPGDILDAAGNPWRVKPPDRSWTEAPRPMSIPARRLSRRELAVRSARLQIVVPQRPVTRADCVGGPRPCPWAACRHHLYLDVSEQGWLKVNYPGLEVWQMAETCSLDVADRSEDAGGVTLEQLGKLFNISLEGARQVELDVLGELRAKLGEDEMRDILVARRTVGDVRE
jgi:hypothetical protein